MAVAGASSGLRDPCAFKFLAFKFLVFKSFPIVSLVFEPFAFGDFTFELFTVDADRTADSSDAAFSNGITNVALRVSFFSRTKTLRDIPGLSV